MKADAKLRYIPLTEPCEEHTRFTLTAGGDLECGDCGEIVDGFLEPVICCAECGAQRYHYRERGTGRYLCKDCLPWGVSA